MSLFRLFGATAPADPARGIYAIWLKPGQDVSRLPFVKGGQIAFQWADLEPAEGRYDFSGLDASLAAFHKQGRKATIQVNGGRRPTYLYRRIAVYPEKLSHQIGDKQGSLQYWDPLYLRFYTDFIAAWGRHLRASPYRSAVLGIRLNFNALGTEHMGVKGEANKIENWKPAPDGRRFDTPDSPALDRAYRRAVVDAFTRAFVPDVPVFVRNNIVNDPDVGRELAPKFASGALGLFHTSSECEPRGKGGEGQYRAFLTYCRSGKTLGYAESWADAEGFHGGKRDRHTQSPPQWNYWRLLVDLHCGVSFIAVYGSDLARAGEPEFRAAFDWAARYAGLHARPDRSPGAWVALREGNVLKGDYTFLMKRLEGEGGAPVENAGPRDQRFGAWARTLAPGGALRFALDPAFAASLKKKPCRLRVVFLDTGKTPFAVAWAGGPIGRPIPRANTGRWREEVVAVPSASFAGASSAADITLTATGGEPCTFHMIEVSRGA